MTRMSSTSTARRRPGGRRRAGHLVLVSLVGVGGWLGYGPATRALGLDVIRVEGPGLTVPWSVPEPEQPSPTPTPTPTALDPVLADRFAAAQAAAGAAGVPLTLTSGWRSAAEQEALVDEALATYGSAQEAHRWVLPPEKSAHVAGLAVDVGPMEGALWLGERAEDFGLCRTYDNEWWHFEPMPADGGCPAPLPDSSWGWQ